MGDTYPKIVLKRAIQQERAYFIVGEDVTLAKIEEALKVYNTDPNSCQLVKPDWISISIQRKVLQPWRQYMLSF